MPCKPASGASPFGDSGLDCVLDGSIQRSSGRIRIIARLLDMRAGGEVIWASRFDSEAIDNIPAGVRSRETWRFTGWDAFEELFEIAEPGKGFELYSHSKLKRL